MRRLSGTIVKFGIFATIMVVMTVFLFMTFANVRTGSTTGYSAVFTDASRLKSGDTVRVAGVEVGSVKDLSLTADRKVVVDFDAGRNIVLTTGTQAHIRYLNLTGDRYLELIDGPGSTRILPAGSQIPVSRTAPALDLDLLLGGLKPVIQGLNPKDVNALTNSLIQIFQGQGGTLESLLSKTSSFSNSLADNNEIIEELIDNLGAVLQTLSKDGDEFSGAIDRLEKLVSGLSQDRDPIGNAITALDNGTASLTDLLGAARPPLKETVNQVQRLAGILSGGNDEFDATLKKLPNIYRKLARVGSYGAFFPYYICGITFRASDLDGRTVVFPFIKSDAGRCTDD